MHSETLYAWKRKFMGMQGADVQKLRQLTDENARLKKVVADMALEVDALKDALEKNS
jgi:putative transposase